MNSDKATESDESIDMLCRVCERRERFDSVILGKAWLTGHIQEEHADKIPEFEGTDSTEKEQ